MLICTIFPKGTKKREHYAQIVLKCNFTQLGPVSIIVMSLLSSYKEQGNFY